ncbi:MAG TPA: hypothetical protein VIR26_08300 [Metalysinibacillus sp.]
MKLNQTLNPISFAERKKINENWEEIVRNIHLLDSKINILAGGDEVDEILARIAKATTDAIKATSDANSATGKANTATSNANSATSKANTAASKADTATASANNKIVEVNQVLADADIKIKAAIKATDDAIVAKKNADTATSKANASASKADVATGKATTATAQADEATAKAIDAAQKAVEATDNATKAFNDITLVINNFKATGDYSATKQYNKYNVVLFNGSSFTALQDTKGNAPPTGTTTTNAHWQMLAQRGVDGKGAVASVNGVMPGIDGNVSLGKGDVGLGSVENYKVATQTEAEEGTYNASYMTPLRTKQAVNKLAGKVNSVSGVKPDMSGDVPLTIGDLSTDSQLSPSVKPKDYPLGVTTFRTTSSVSDEWKGLVGDGIINTRVLVVTYKADNVWQSTQTIYLIDGYANTGNTIQHRSMYVRSAMASTVSDGNDWSAPVKILSASDLSGATTSNSPNTVATSKAVYDLQQQINDLRNAILQLGGKL